MINAANLITSLRVIFAIVLLFTDPFSAMFYMCYLICGVSDVLDGFVARKFHLQSEFGAKLDSFSDVLFLIVVIVKLYPVLIIPTMYITWAICIFAIKLLCILIIYNKYKTFGMLHTYLIKGCGVILFLGPLFLELLGTNLVLLIACIAGTISTLEELFINATSKELDLNKKTMFS